MKVGANAHADPPYATKEEKKIRDYMEMLLLVQMHKYGNGMNSKTPEWMGDNLFKLLQQ